MSSLDSGLNSLSAVTMKDYYQRYWKKDADEKHYLIASKVITFMWGIFCVVAALVFAGFGQATRQTTIVLINAVGSMLYGPILAAFLIGMFTKRIGPSALKIGIFVGIATNFILWIFTPISWLWWNLTGFLAMLISTFLAAIYFGLGKRDVPHTTIRKYVDDPSTLPWRKVYKYVVLYFFSIIFVCWLIEHLG
jgi:Na+/proline symporter